jgi:hypothetical protein
MSPSKVPGKKAGPNGSFPVGDPKHARLAIGGATRSFNAGNIGKGTEQHIKSEARAELGGKAKPKKKKKIAAAVPEFAAGRRTFGQRSYPQFGQGQPAPQQQAPGLGAGAPADDEEAPTE